MSLGMIGGIARLGGDKSLGIPGKSDFASGTSIERLIPAGSPYLVSLRGLYSRNICIITFKVTPTKGKDYEAVYSWGGGKCYVSLNEVATSNSGEVIRHKATNAEQTTICSKGFN